MPDPHLAGSVVPGESSHPYVIEPEISPLVGLLVDVVQGLRGPEDVEAVLKRVITRIGEVLHADDVGVLLADAEGQLQLTVASNDDASALEMLQLAADDGPCVTAFQDGLPSLVADLEDDAKRHWPRWAIKARRLGYASALAVPLTFADMRLGAINLLGRRPGMFGPAELELATALTNVTTMLLLAQRRQVDSDRLTGQLQHALDSRVVIEQAKGALSERNQVSTTAAFQLLRGAARNASIKVDLAAAAVLLYED